MPDKDQNVLVNTFIPSDNNGVLIKRSVSVGKTVTLNFTKFTGTATVTVTPKTKNGGKVDNGVISIKWKSKLNVYGTSSNYDYNTVQIECWAGPSTTWNGCPNYNSDANSNTFNIPVPNNTVGKSTLIFGNLQWKDTSAYYNQWIIEYVAKTLNLVNGQTYDVTLQMTK
ncbi:MAG: hypothetical protein AABW72_05715 [archaeon]